MDALHMILVPRMTEKTFGLSQTARTYVFIVPKDANKITVKQSVEAQFAVAVTNVNMLTNKGKVKRTYRKGGKSVMGSRSNTKRAYVTLKDGDSIPVFAAALEEEAEAEKAANKAAELARKGKK